MIIDSSAVIAVLNGEPERSAFEEAIETSKSALSAVSYLEASVVLLSRRGEAAFASLDSWIEAAEIEVVPFTSQQVRMAREAYARFGKGRHVAGLNFGDTASYALASERGESLLFKGEDFSATDIEDAVKLTP